AARSPARSAAIAGRAGRGTDMDRTHAHQATKWTDATHGGQPAAEANILGVAEPALDAPTLAIQTFEKARGRVLITGGQAPRPLHVLVPHAQNGAYLILIGRHHGAAQNGGPPAWPNPSQGGTFLTVRRRHLDVAAKADDVIEVQLLGEHPVEFLIAEAAVRNDTDLDSGWQHIGESDEYLIFILVAMVLECGGVHRQPDQRRRAAVTCHQ